MKTIQATLEHGELILDEPLPMTESKFPALVIIAGEFAERGAIPAQKLAEKSFSTEEEFEAIGLRDFFGDPVDGSVNWEAFFSEPHK